LIAQDKTRPQILIIPQHTELHRESARGKLLTTLEVETLTANTLKGWKSSPRQDDFAFAP
jgi:hypothetical protein